MPYEAIGVYRSLCTRQGMAPTLYGLAGWWRKEGKHAWNTANIQNWPRGRQAAATELKATTEKIAAR